jgi:nickel-dependent lactate racemase
MQWVSSSLLQQVGPPVDAAITTGAGYPLDLTFYQSVKGVTAAAQIVRPGGRILLFGACEEGAGAAEFSHMMTRYSSHQEFLAGIEGVPVTIDQWQLEKLALAARKAEVFYCVPGLPDPYMQSLWGPGFKEPDEAICAFFSGLAPGSRVAVIPEGPYVLANATAAA